MQPYRQLPDQRARVAQYRACLRSWLSQIPEIKDRHEVIPGSEEIIVKFKDDLPEGRTPIFKERLTQLKNEMQQKMKKPINTFVFEFPSQTIRI